MTGISGCDRYAIVTNLESASPSGPEWAACAAGAALLAVLDPPVLLLEPLIRLGITTIGELLDLPLATLLAAPGVGDRKFAAYLLLRRAARTHLRRAGISCDGEANDQAFDPTPALRRPIPVPTHPLETHLADRLAARGLNLDQPIEALLPQLSTRLCDCLRRVGMRTGRQLAVALDTGGIPASTSTVRRRVDLSRPWREVLTDLPAGVRKHLLRSSLMTVGHLVDAIREHRFPGETGRRTEVYLRVSLVRVIGPLEPDIDTEEGPDPGAAQGPIPRAHLLPQALALGRLPLCLVPGIGPGSLRLLRAGLEELLDDSLPWHHPQSPGRSTVSGLVADALAILTNDDRALANDRFFLGRELPEIAVARGHLLIPLRRSFFRITQRLRTRFGGDALLLLKGLIAEMPRRRGLIHRDAVAALCGEKDLRKVRFALHLCQQPFLFIRRDEFFMETPTRYRQMLAGLRNRLKYHFRGEAELAALHADLRLCHNIELPVQELVRLLQLEWGVSIHPSGKIASPEPIKKPGPLSASGTPPIVATPPVRATPPVVAATTAPMSRRPPAIGKRLIDVLLSSRRPMTREELALPCRHRWPGSAYQDQPPTPTETELIAVRVALNRQEEVLRCGDGRYVHRDALGLSPQQIDRVVAHCLHQLTVLKGPATAQGLLLDLSRAALPTGQFSPATLWHLLAKQEGVVALSRSALAPLRILRPNEALVHTHPELAAEWHPTRNRPLTPLGVLAHSMRWVSWRCDRGHIWTASVRARTRGQPCPRCAQRLGKLAEQDVIKERKGRKELDS